MIYLSIYIPLFLTVFFTLIGTYGIAKIDDAFGWVIGLGGLSALFVMVFLFRLVNVNVVGGG
jgi:hypothetical protein